MVIAFIVTALTKLYFAGRLLPIVSAKSSSNSAMSNANYSQLILESWPKKIYFVSLFKFQPFSILPVLSHRNSFFCTTIETLRKKQITSIN